MTKISIIIPMLNEAKNIEKLLHYILKNTSNKNILEILVVDGGSTDASQTLVKSINNITLLNAEKGRAIQMNVGAKNAKGNILYFLHADSFPPINFDTYIVDEVEKGNHAGCFIMKFNSAHWWLKLAGFLTKLPWKACRGGDQSLFVTTTLFNKIGGFNENYMVYEDNDFIAKIYKLNSFVVIQKWLTTSARRYNSNGIWTLQYHFLVIHFMKWCGSSAENLSNYYTKYISVKN